MRVCRFRDLANANCWADLEMRSCRFNPELENSDIEMLHHLSVDGAIYSVHDFDVLASEMANLAGDNDNCRLDKDMYDLDVCFQAKTDTRCSENAPCAALSRFSILALDVLVGGDDVADVDLMAQPVPLSGPHSENSSRAPT